MFLIPTERRIIHFTVGGRCFHVRYEFLNALNENSALRLLQLFVLLHYSTISTSVLDFGWGFTPPTGTLWDYTDHQSYLNPTIFATVCRMLGGVSLDIRHQRLSVHSPINRASLHSVKLIAVGGREIQWTGSMYNSGEFEPRVFERAYTPFDTLVIQLNDQLCLRSAEVGGR